MHPQKSLKLCFISKTHNNHTSSKPSSITYTIVEHIAFAAKGTPHPTITASINDLINYERRTNASALRTTHQIKIHRVLI